MYVSYRDGFDPIKAIVPSPFGKEEPTKKEKLAAHSRKMAELEGKTACFKSWYYTWGLPFVEVYCKEHQRGELVPNGNSDDFDWWYQSGLHPRFSIRRTLFEAGAQRVLETTFWGFLGRRDNSDVEKTLLRKLDNVGMTFQEILRKSETPEQFLELVRPILFTNLNFRRRRYRVRIWFKEKFKAHTFTIKDFLEIPNQELRRLMIRRGLSIQDVLDQMKFIAEDEEGKLYETKEWPHLRYLYVKCPSTGQEYLLGVPTAHMVNGSNVVIDSPKEARRWTFDLPVDSIFAQEA